jgi:hypothetical protein
VLYLNGEKIVPYKMASTNTEYVEKLIVNNERLENGATIHIEHYTIGKSLPDSDWFKYALSSIGAYIFKSGRLITKVNGGAEYRKIFGFNPHNNHNGMIVLINITGEVDTLPITVPTKTKFKIYGNPNYDMLIECLQKHVRTPLQNKSPSEENLLREFQQTRQSVFKTSGIKHEMLIEETIKFGDQPFSSPSIDAYENINSDKIFIYEAKRDNMVKLEHIIQLYGNFMLATLAIQSRDSTEIVPIPVLLINIDRYTLPPKLAHTIKTFNDQSKIGFPMQVWNYKAEILFPFK